MKRLFMCEICKAYYEDERAAEFCESNLLPLPPFKIGDKIPVKTRYNGIREHAVTGYSAGSYLFPICMRGRTYDEGMAVWKSHHHDELTHHRIYLIAEEEQLGKDFYSDEIGEGSIATLEEVLEAKGGNLAHWPQRPPRCI